MQRRRRRTIRRLLSLSSSKSETSSSSQRNDHDCLSSLNPSLVLLPTGKLFLAPSIRPNFLLALPDTPTSTPSPPNRNLLNALPSPLSQQSTQSPIIARRPSTPAPWPLLESCRVSSGRRRMTGLRGKRGRSLRRFCFIGSQGGRRRGKGGKREWRRRREKARRRERCRCRALSFFPPVSSPTN
jgi:hypothetical protein